MSIRRQQNWVLWLILLSGVTLTVIAFRFSISWENRSQQLIFQHRVDGIVATLNKELAINIEVLLSLNSLFQSSQHVDRGEFEIYTKSKLARFDTIQALEWVPRVSDDERMGHEQQARNEGLENYVITQGSRAGTMVAADKRAEYYPVYYVEPLSGNEIVIGFDLASNSSRKAVMQEAAARGEVRATTGIQLLQGDLGIMIAVPLFSQDEARQLLGFNLGVYRIARIVSKVFELSYIDPAEFHMKIWDSSTVSGSPALLYSNADESQESATRTYTASLAVAGRTWRIELTPTDQFIAEGGMAGPWVILVAGLLLSLLLTQYVRVLRYREAKVRYLVEQRTQELALSERTTNTIVDSAVTAVITIDKHGSVRRFNPAAEKIFGYASDEVVGNNVKMLMPEPYQSEHDRYLQNYQQTGDAKIIGIPREVSGLRKDGAVFPMLLSVGEARVESDPIYVGTVLDITLQKEAEHALIHAKNLAERSNRQKSEFLNMMSHELRTPLTVILGYLPLLKKAEALPPSETVAAIAADMDASGQHLLALINDLLDLSKIEAGSMRLHREMISAREVTDSVMSKLAPAAEKKGLELVNRTVDELMYADPLRLQQILINLIGNAIKFTQHGTIQVEAELIAGFVQMTVADTGSGIAAEDLPVIFDKFSQIDSSSTRSLGGSGLGLAITRQLVQLHGGEISVTSQLGKGSQFIFTIPVSGGAG
ncbi:CHASE domain-containing sensor histidine kinase [Sedimenticola selenatireducens]|uniref:Sensor protein FixL n=1 Tax=Sedimenticola selenatireducens TaxID=191960 RepID=A0A557S3P7_9GAMM|nr:CHASE domain-containing protein [Sedimenticola selenatireducens]TVO71947.1 PAS domain S-box protein [Sedimenticola selenatireducens]TVT66327.1 MAG: PAS domain S-box protein [Sedimenticola selenatireducens]